MTVSRPEAAVDVTVVLPCLDERDAVGLCVTIDAMKMGGLDGEVVVVDNGSTDGSDEPRRAVGLGLLVAGVGLFIDGALFVAWLGDVDVTRPTGVSFGFASLAQTLLIVGGSMAVIGVLSRFARTSEGIRAPTSESRS